MGNLSIHNNEAHPIAEHNIFNINLTKFGQSDVKGGRIFFLQVWDEVSFPQISRERNVITPLFFFF